MEILGAALPLTSSSNFDSNLQLCGVYVPILYCSSIIFPHEFTSLQTASLEVTEVGGTQTHIFLMLGGV